MRRQCVYRSKFESWHVDNRKRVKFRWQASLCELFYKSVIYNLSHLNRYVYVLLMLPHNSVEKQRIVVFGEGHNLQQLHEEIKNLISVEISRVSRSVSSSVKHAHAHTYTRLLPLYQHQDSLKTIVFPFRQAPLCLCLSCF